MTPAEEIHEAARLMRERADWLDEMLPSVPRYGVTPAVMHAVAAWLDDASHGSDNSVDQAPALAVAREFLRTAKP